MSSYFTFSRKINGSPLTYCPRAISMQYNCQFTEQQLGFGAAAIKPAKYLLLRGGLESYNFLFPATLETLS